MQRAIYIGMIRLFISMPMDEICIIGIKIKLFIQRIVVFPKHSKTILRFCSNSKISFTKKEKNISSNISLILCIDKENPKGHA